MNARPALVVLLLAAACTPEYAYAPTTNASLTTRGDVAATYRIPSSSPQGDIRLASSGMTEVTAKSATHESLRALHLRVILADASATPWTFDTREQRIEIRGRPALAPAFAAASPGSSAAPLITVDGKSRRVVDLFFLLPAELQRSSAVPEFDAIWRVHTGASVSSERTPFQRFTVEPGEATFDEGDRIPYALDYYWGPPYWISADIPFGSVPREQFENGLTIRRSPRFTPKPSSDESPPSPGDTDILR